MSVHVTTKRIKKDWTDYNEHMNMAYYVLVFDEYFHLRCLLAQLIFHLVFQGDVFLVQSFEY